ncbi:MAG: DUF839 domain-containing protein [Kiloniellales bacterium]|nr:DUF839 domain-containing protein [Kiloniellales bacterium]
MSLPEDSAGAPAAVDSSSEARLSRRSLLKGSAVAVAGLSAPAAAFQAFLAKPAQARGRRISPDYGALVEVVDPNTGLPLLKLPPGFQYVSFGITGETMADGSLTPGGHDGMAVAREIGRRVVLVRNHELGSGTPFGSEKTPTFAPDAAGGTTNLVFDRRRTKLVEDWASLTGTVRNCAGGPNPLARSWITCEETTTEGHGYIFEVPASGRVSAVPIRDAGRFSHEAVAVDPFTGQVYETEDSGISGFYRFIPHRRWDLERGGRLQMLRVKGSDGPVNLNGGNPSRNELAVDNGLPEGGPIEVGASFEVDWVDIPVPDPGPEDAPVVAQGLAEGAAFFTRGEGAWYSRGSVFFTSTDGGEARQGQVWEYDIRRKRLTLIFESVDAFALNNPDNITVARGGGILLCEDGGGIRDEDGNIIRGEQLVGLSTEGDLFPFAENNIVIPEGQTLGGQTGDQRRREWAGATFTRDGEWLFVNIQTPGVTFAITGPWDQGPLGRRGLGKFFDDDDDDDD